MYYKLPVKERIELMKSYRKANPDMSYQDMVKDYNNSYQKFEDGGKKKVEPYQPKSQADYLFRQKMYNDSLALGKYTDLQKALEPKGSSFNFENTDESNKKRQGLLQNYAAKIIKENPSIKYYMYEGIPYKGEYGKLPERVGEYNKYLASPDLTHPLIKPTGSWEGAAANDTYVKPVQKILPYNQPKIVNKLNKTNTIIKSKPTVEREPIYVTDKNDPRLKAYNDSLDTYNFNKQALNKIINENKTPKVIKPSTTKDKSGRPVGVIGQIPKMWSKKDVTEEYWNKFIKKYPGAIGLDPNNVDKDSMHSPIYPTPKNKKPEEVLPQVKPQIVPQIPTQNIKPVVQDTVKYQPVINSTDEGLTRRWNFNASNPTLEYYDKSNKLVKSEYYKNMNDFKQGKQINYK